MSSGSGPLAGYVVLLMLSTIVVYGFPVHHVPSGNKLAPTPSITFLKKTMTRPKYSPFRENKELYYLRNAIIGSLKGVPDVLSESSGKSNNMNVIHKTGSSLVQVDSSVEKVPRGENNMSASGLRVQKRCVDCSGRDDDVTTERPVFMFDPLATAEVENVDEMEGVPPTNNSLIILPLMAIIVFIGTVCAKCCRWTQKDVRDVGFIVEAKPLKKNTIAKGIMQMHNFGLTARTNRSKKSKNLGVRAPEQFMFLPLLLGQSITVRPNNSLYTRAKTPPKTVSKRTGSGRQLQSLTETYDPGNDASEDTDEEKPFVGPGYKRQTSSQPGELALRKSVSPPSRGSKGSKSSSKRSRSTNQGSLDCPDIELDSSEEERLELEEQCRRGLAVLAHINPVPLASKPRRSSLASRSTCSSGSTKIFSGQKVSVQVDVHEGASGSAHDLKVPREQHGSRHSSADACVDTHDLIEHIEDYYGVDIRAFINLWQQRRRFANISDAVDLPTAATYARHHEITRSKSCKYPKKSKPYLKRQVSFPLDLPQSLDQDSHPPIQGSTPPMISRSVSTVEDDVFTMPEETLQITPVKHRQSNCGVQIKETVELSTIAVPDGPESFMLEELSNLPLSPAISHHSICDDSGYHNHSFSKLVTSQPGPPLHRTSSDDSAVATNLASESSQSNPDGSPREGSNTVRHSVEGCVVSLSLSDLTLQDRLNSQDGQDTCASDSMQRTPSLQMLVDCKESSQPLGASCHAQDHAHENGVFSKSGHKPKLKDIANHVNMSSVGSNDMSNDTEKLLGDNPTDGYNAESSRKHSKTRSGLFSSGKEVPVSFHLGEHGDGQHGCDRGGEDESSDHDESFDSSPNAPLLHYSIIKSRASSEKSTDRDLENNNEHLV
ncbi:uncharacterized protein LOC135503533 [Lineus longissimus]|uniref:uncharacterized protein LOC135503533 n=1 Tax=Lineus longissimus TaxID=88925 RepID=UPI002B4F0C79